MEAQRALDAGKLILARRRLARVARRCPAEAARALSWEAALALGDAAEIEAERRAIRDDPRAPPALRAAAAHPAPRYAGDIPSSLAPSKHPEADYRVAARAFVDGKLDEAWSAALSVALAGGDLDAEAFLVAARVAEARHDAPQAKRMYARAYQAECRDGCDGAVEPPDTRLASLAAAQPGLRPFRPTCVNATATEGSEPPGALTPDGRFYLWGVGGGVQVRALPSHVLVDWIEVKPPKPMIVCASSSARWFFLHVAGPPDTLQIVPSGGGAPVRLRPPRPTFFLRSPDAIVAQDGALLAPDFEDYDGVRTWYRASPRAPGLRPLRALHGSYVPAVLPNGDFLGIVDRRTDKAGRYLGAFARFDAKTGRLAARISPAPEASIPWLAASPSGKTAFALQVTTPRAMLLLDLASGALHSATIPDGEPVGIADSTSVVVSTHGRITLVDVAAGTAAPAGAVGAPSDAARADFAGPDITIDRDGDALRLARQVGEVHATLWIRLTPDGKGGFAVDDKGYYETFGTGADLLRRAATCHVEHPIEMCADRWEEPGLVEHFRRGDLGYRDP